MATFDLDRAKDFLDRSSGNIHMHNSMRSHRAIDYNGHASISNWDRKKKTTKKKNVDKMSKSMSAFDYEHSTRRSPRSTMSPRANGTTGTSAGIERWSRQAGRAPPTVPPLPMHSPTGRRSSRGQRTTIPESPRGRHSGRTLPTIASPGAADRSTLTMRTSYRSGSPPPLTHMSSTRRESSSKTTKKRREAPRRRTIGIEPSIEADGIFRN